MKNKSDFVFENLEDLKAYKVGGVAGYFYLEMFNNSGIKYDYSDNEADSLQKLVAGRIDLLPFTTSNGWDLIRSKYPDEASNFGTLDKPLDSNSIGLIISKNYQSSNELLSQFNSAVRKIVENGKYQAILTAHGQQEGSIIE
ncbi:MAG: transporter substrate-binding domain-containing protein [archaeon]